jgi:hypothetical protein
MQFIYANRGTAAAQTMKNTPQMNNIKFRYLKMSQIYDRNKYMVVIATKQREVSKKSAIYFRVVYTR